MSKPEPEYCPFCGKFLEVPAVFEREHIFTLHCDKCNIRLTVWMTLPIGQATKEEPQS